MTVLNSRQAFLRQGLDSPTKTLSSLNIILTHFDQKKKRSHPDDDGGKHHKKGYTQDKAEDENEDEEEDEDEDEYDPEQEGEDVC